MSDQPKPATGEWTMESLDVITKGSKGPVEEWQRIIYAHKAALAAERENAANAWLNSELGSVKQLREQLEAERQDQVETLADLQDAMAQSEQLRSQLAAMQATMRRIDSELTGSLPVTALVKEICRSGLSGDTAALDAAIAEAHSEGRRKQAAYEVEHHQQPLLDALTRARKDLGCVSIDAIGRDIDDALTKVKEEK